jgi:PIN domain nuclease of toxin-antitoxin system
VNLRGSGFALECSELLAGGALGRRVAGALESTPRIEAPDLPDRIVAATAVALQVPFVSRDRKIRTSAVNTIW